MAVFRGPGPAEDNGAAGPMQALVTAALELDFVPQGWRLFEEKDTFEYSHCFETSARKILVLIAGLKAELGVGGFPRQEQRLLEKGGNH